MLFHVTSFLCYAAFLTTAKLQQLCSSVHVLSLSALWHCDQAKHTDCLPEALYMTSDTSASVPASWTSEVWTVTSYSVRVLLTKALSGLLSCACRCSQNTMIFKGQADNWDV